MLLPGRGGSPRLPRPVCVGTRTPASLARPQPRARIHCVNSSHASNVSTHRTHRTHLTGARRQHACITPAPPPGALTPQTELPSQPARIWRPGRSCHLTTPAGPSRTNRIANTLAGPQRTRPRLCIDQKSICAWRGRKEARDGTQRIHLLLRPCSTYRFPRLLALVRQVQAEGAIPGSRHRRDKQRVESSLAPSTQEASPKSWRVSFLSQMRRKIRIESTCRLSRAPALRTMSKACTGSALGTGHASPACLRAAPANPLLRVRIRQITPRSQRQRGLTFEWRQRASEHSKRARHHPPDSHLPHPARPTTLACPHAPHTSACPRHQPLAFPAPSLPPVMGFLS